MSNSSTYFFVLASTSPRRRELLKILGIPFIVAPPTMPDAIIESKIGQSSYDPIDEAPLQNESPQALVQRLSRLKAQAVLTRLPSLEPPTFISTISNQVWHQAVVIAADTIVVLNNQILGKPRDPAEAVRMLKQLRDYQCHTVYSGLTVAMVPEINPKSSETGDHLITRLHQSIVWMRPYTDAEIEAYVGSGDPLDKAGAYGIQNSIFAPVSRLDGCFASVMGLPLGELATAMRQLNRPVPKISPLCSQHTGYSCCRREDNSGLS
jgi:MAF protein